MSLSLFFLPFTHILLSDPTEILFRVHKTSLEGFPFKEKEPDQQYSSVML